MSTFLLILPCLNNAPRTEVLNNMVLVSWLGRHSIYHRIWNTKINTNLTACQAGRHIYGNPFTDLYSSVPCSI